MGVKGLTTFIDEHRFLTDSRDLSNTKLVIDGYSLLYHLYTTAELDMRHGGENLAFYGICQTFVNNLRECGIEPFILIDGAIDTDKKKFSTLRDRHKDRIRKGLSLAKGSHGLVLPFLAVDVFRQALMDHQVNFAQCDFEADSDISALANAYSCPVLSNDSDFYVTDLTDGFINLKDFHYQYINSKSKAADGGGFYLRCKIYHVNKFCKHFKIKKSFLPLLGTLQGNDYIDRFLDKKLKDMIHWLAAFGTPEDALEAALNYQHHPQRGIFREKIQASMAMYTANRTSEYAAYFQTHKINQEECQLWQNHDIPLWFVTEFRDGLLPADSLNALLIKKCFMANFIEGPHHTSSNEISLPIRQIIYGFIHQDNCIEEPMIEEYDREGSSVKCRQVSPSYNSNSISIHTIRSLDKAQSKQILLDCILLKAEDLKDIKREFQLPIASMIYWIKKAETEVCWRHIVALLLGFIISTSIKRLHEEQSTQCSQGEEDNGNLILQRFTHMGLKFMAREYHFDVNASHMFAQWQSVLKCISHLNTFLSSPLLMFDVSVMYNGKFVHVIYNFLKTFQKPRKALEYVNQSQVLENDEFGLLSCMYRTVVHHCSNSSYRIGDDVQASESSSREYVGGSGWEPVGSSGGEPVGGSSRQFGSGKPVGGSSRQFVGDSGRKSWASNVSKYDRGSAGGSGSCSGGSGIGTMYVVYNVTNNSKTSNMVYSGSSGFRSGGKGSEGGNMGSAVGNRGSGGGGRASDGDRRGSNAGSGAGSGKPGSASGNRGHGGSNQGSAVGNRGSGCGNKGSGGVHPGSAVGNRGSGGGNRGSGSANRGSGCGNKGSGGANRGGGGRGCGGGGNRGGGNLGSAAGNRGSGGGNPGSAAGNRGSGGGNRGSGGGNRGSGGGNRGGSGGGGSRGSGHGNRGGNRGSGHGNRESRGGGRGTGGGNRGHGHGNRGSRGGGRGSAGGNRGSGGGGRGSAGGGK